MVLLTCATLRDLLPEDRAVAACLREAGETVEAAVWDSAELRAGDVAVVRSVWDYHQRPREFVRFLEQLAPEVRLWNPREALLWNVNKRYMLELAARGVPTVPTEMVGPGWSGKGCPWPHVVLKPAVGASGEGVRALRLPLGPQEARRVERALAVHPEGMLLQPFVRSIATAGELSAVFIAGAFSHCVRKIPPAGDFRVQGGKVREAGGGGRGVFSRAWAADNCGRGAAGRGHGRVCGSAGGGGSVAAAVRAGGPGAARGAVGAGRVGTAGSAALS